eukprot:TRINITY_DN1885_c0_g3_i1.p1 TRINITY_DN1885_c0_g3~~TRINITY_DN1885_c0_g3_i1.p1  ORF type:complete len:893 (+),score=141.13 TRINITY_DN1885_c0_g3_i1:112-2679(+)
MGGSIRAARVTPADEYSKSCVIEGPPDSGISVSFPVTKCLKECNRAVPWKEVGNGAMQITKQFSLLFTTQIEGNHCVCSDKRGAKLVKYKLSKKMKKQCSRNSDKAKMECWNTYKMTRAATLDFSGSSPVVKINYQKSKDDTFTFITNSNRCFDCEGESCRSFSLPSPIASMSKREREAIAGVGPQMKTGGLKTFMDALVTDATSGLVGGSFASENAESEPESDAVLVGASEVAPSLWVMQLQLTKIWRIVVKPEAAQRDGNEDTFIQGVFRIFLNLLLFGHVMASCLLAVGNRESAGGFVSWVDVSLAGIDSCPVLYMDALYFAVISLTSVGYSDALVTSLEHSVNCVFLLLAQLYSAKVCADLTWTISIFNCQEAEFLGRRAQIVLSLKHLGVPKGLVDRVIAFQNYVAHVHIEDLTQPVFSGLSENLLMELQLCAYRELVLQAPFMRNQSKEAILLIVGSLRDAVFLPADFIMRHGEHKRELYFVRRGTAAVFGGVDPPSFCHSAELTHFEKGAYFGEMGMLTGRPRTAWVMARSYCICAVLPYSAVGVLSQEYPGSFTHLVQSMVGVYNMRSKTSWPELSRRFAKHGLRTTEAAYRWCCRQAGGDEDSEVTAKRFDEGLRKLNVCGFDRQVLWAEIDNDNSGIICLQEFEDLINVEGAINGTYVSENAEQSRNSQGVGDEVEQSLQYRNSWMSDVGAGGKGDQDLRGSTRSSACIEKEDLKRTISCGSSASLLSEMPSMSGHAASRGTHAWGVVRGPTIDSVPPLPGMTSLTGAHQGDPTLEALQEVQAALYEAGDRLNEPIRKIIGQQNRASFASRASSEGPVFGPNRESCRSYASGRQIRTSEGSWMAE